MIEHGSDCAGGEFVRFPGGAHDIRAVVALGPGGANHGNEEWVLLAPPRSLTIATAMEWIDAVEVVEVTPAGLPAVTAGRQCNRCRPPACTDHTCA